MLSSLAGIEGLTLVNDAKSGDMLNSAFTDGMKAGHGNSDTSGPEKWTLFVRPPRSHFLPTW
jgi:hypothetical protein